jgi:hypothetical protein
MNIIIDIYIFVCVMLLLFDIVFLLTKNLKNRKLYPQKNKLKDMIRSELENYNPKIGLSHQLKDFLNNKIEKTKNLIILQKELENTTLHRQKILTEIRPYIFNKIGSYQNKNEYEQAYYAYVVSCFDYEKEKYDEKFYNAFLEFLDSKSLYVFSNTMNAIYKFSDPYLMSIAIQKVNERNGFYHSKLFIDGLLEFKGDVDILHSLIIEKFYQYSNLTQESLLNYFRIKGADVDEFCLDILKEQKVNKEVLYAAMRYFSKHYNEQAKTIFIDILKDSETFWVEQLLAIQALNEYDEPLVKHVIKEKITSKNWHVRINAISYLHDHTLSREEIFYILSLNDQYTNEALLYYYKDDKEISEYIIETINRLSEEQNEIGEINSALSTAF